MRIANGFSLIELMIVVSLLAILTAIAVPAYMNQVENTRRTDGQRSLMDAYTRMERFFTENNTYNTATINTNVNTDILTDPDGGTAGVMPSNDGFYNISITAQTATSFTLTATPTGAQTGDTTCANLTINQLGQRGNSGGGSLNDCWK